MPRHERSIAAGSRRVVLVTAVLLAALPLTARAETLQATLGSSLRTGAPGAQAAASLQLRDVRVQDTHVALGLTVDDAVQLDLAMRATDSFGPLGNVIGEADFAVRTDGQAQGSLGARGVLGPVALGVRLSGFTTIPARFDPLAIAGADRPSFASGGWGVGLDGTVRPIRSLVVEAAPELYLVDGRASWRFDGRLRWLRAIGPHELSLRLLGYLAPGASAGDAAAGVGFTYRRRRAPALDGAVYLGFGPGGLAPGATASLSQQLGPVLASLAVEAEPFRRDVAPYRLQLSASFAAGPGTASLLAAGAAGPAGDRAALQLRYAMPVDLVSP